MLNDHKGTQKDPKRRKTIPKKKLNKHKTTTRYTNRPQKEVQKAQKGCRLFGVTNNQ